MYTKPKPLTQILFIGLGVFLFFSLVLYAGYYPIEKYQDNCKIFCDTLKPKHGFYDVRIIKSYLPALPKGSPFVNCTIQLKGFIYPRNTSREFAKCYAENVLGPSFERPDTIFIVYILDSTIIEKYVFPYSEISE